MTDIAKMDPAAIIDELWDMLNCQDGCPDCAPIRERLDALKAALQPPTGEIGKALEGLEAKAKNLYAFPANGDCVDRESLLHEHADYLDTVKQWVGETQQSLTGVFTLASGEIATLTATISQARAKAEHLSTEVFRGSDDARAAFAELAELLEGEAQPCPECERLTAALERVHDELEHICLSRGSELRENPGQARAIQHLIDDVLHPCPTCKGSGKGKGE